MLETAGEKALSAMQVVNFALPNAYFPEGSQADGNGTFLNWILSRSRLSAKGGMSDDSDGSLCGTDGSNCSFEPARFSRESGI